MTYLTFSSGFARMTPDRVAAGYRASDFEFAGLWAGKALSSPGCCLFPARTGNLIRRLVSRRGVTAIGAQTTTTCEIGLRPDRSASERAAALVLCPSFQKLTKTYTKKPIPATLSAVKIIRDMALPSLASYSLTRRLQSEDYSSAHKEVANEGLRTCGRTDRHSEEGLKR